MSATQPTSSSTRIVLLFSALTSLMAVGCAARYYLQEHCDRPSSVLVGWMMRRSTQPTVPSRSIRSLFSRMLPVKTRAAANHTHAASARSRSKASSEINSLALQLGVRAHYLEQSPSDQKLGRDGSRSYYWAKDLSAQRRAPNPDAPMYASIDVDYYMDMPAFLAKHAVPVALYTLVPSAVAREGGEYSFTFNENNEVVYTVSGGASYKHPIWDYGADIIVAERKILWGLWNVSVVYNVDRRQVDDDHQIILLTPIARTSAPFVRLSHLVEVQVLKRLQVVQSTVVDGANVSFTRLDVQTKEGLLRSTGIANQFVCATIPARVDDAIQLQSNLNKVDLTIAQVKTTAETSDMSIAAVLTSFHRSAITARPSTVYPVDAAVSVFEFKPANFASDNKPAMVPFMHPLALGACVPTVSEANDSQSIDGRVIGVAAPILEISGKMLGYMEEFASFLVPECEVHKAHPVDYDEVYDRQDRPTQRIILDDAAAVGGVSDKPVSSFMKKESYAKVTDPRNISIIPGPNKLKYSAFLYAFSTVLEAQDWYAFALTPLETARRVAEICSTAQKVSMTDLSRCDGRISNLLRVLERIVMLRAFATAYAAELVEIMETQFNQTAYTATGKKYSTGYSRLSGSSETAAFNTVCSAFIAYVALRMGGCDAETAWGKLGLYGGDDGLTADLPHETFAAAATEVGQVLECEEAKRGERGVNFFARYYSPDVWEGALDSMCDVKRQLIKLHLTGVLGQNVTPLMKLREKVRGYMLTDKNTPGLGEYAQLVTQLHGESGPDERLRGVASYWARVGEDNQFPNENAGGWMDEEFSVNFPSFDLPRLRLWIKLTRMTGGDVLAVPLCSEELAVVKPPADVVVDGDIVEAVKESESAVAIPAVAAAPLSQPVKPVGAEVSAPLGAQRTPIASKAKATAVAKPKQAATSAKQPCPHYARGACSFGSKCRFEHVGNIPQAKAPCDLFRKTGACHYGKECKYAHSDAPAASARKPRA